MNYFKICLLAIGVWFFSNCDKGGGDIVEKPSIINVFRLTEATCGNGQITVGTGSLKETENYTFEGKEYNVILFINSDSTFTSQGTYTQIFKSDITGTKEISENPFPSEGTWTFDDNLLMLYHGDNENMEFEVSNHSLTQLEGKYRVKKESLLRTQFATVELKLELEE